MPRRTLQKDIKYLMCSLRIYFSSDQYKWGNKLQEIQFALRLAEHVGPKFPAVKLFYNRSVNTSSEMIWKISEDDLMGVKIIEI